MSRLVFAALVAVGFAASAVAAAPTNTSHATKSDVVECPFGHVCVVTHTGVHL